jgi:hypothetical protein
MHHFQSSESAVFKVVRATLAPLVHVQAAYGELPVAK